MLNFDLNKSLDDLEGCDWGHPEYNSGLIINVHRLRKTPLKDFTNEDLRVMILQQISLDYILPIAFTRLIRNPIASGDHYTGDLFCAILHVNQNYWRNNDELKHELEYLIDEFEETINSIIGSINKYRNTIKDI
ncbi:contact-dependent growth inhibition system immunity protein [Paenibacillus sp. chi10]|uniref:Contact-dependent growth inhibition system immunity protein n=1 Tax=Paenibacillus suaedae TaxID=3077233 RepID=A0AAJ2JV19_9BACL|nr:contact-dependent growth inhibition system immunity protein [Paenibacillus sp. chi10]MDT8976386.1 contact-dependent growth inhibition system immunity protein [Paenibacillus sp. chi10]GAV16107.1 hypothetical protein PBN151_6092 [Paenibacillus sp. NAIST15-1]